MSFSALEVRSVALQSHLLSVRVFKTQRTKKESISFSVSFIKKRKSLKALYVAHKTFHIRNIGLSVRGENSHIWRYNSTKEKTKVVSGFHSLILVI